MGTRVSYGLVNRHIIFTDRTMQFATSSESMYAAERKRLILSTQDGGRSTLKWRHPGSIAPAKH